MTVSNSVIRQAIHSGNPVIDGNQVTLIWEGQTAPTIIGDFNNWDTSSTKFKRISPRLIPDSSKSIWYATLAFPRDAYIEYAFHDPVTQKNFTDPLNKRTVNNGIGGRNNYFYMPETMQSPFSLRRADVTPGALTRHIVDAGPLRQEYERTVYLYRPPVKEPVPLLVVYDGLEYVHRGKLPTIVDNMIADRRIQPLAMALLPGGGRWRTLEYHCSDATLQWLKQTILPLANEQLNLIDIQEHPGTYGVLGASSGAIMALYTGLRLPTFFGKVLSQSGVSSWGGHEFVNVDLVKHKHSIDIRTWMDVGTLDFLLEDNRQMSALMRENGYNVSYREYSGGHNYTTWRDDLWRGLEEMFPYIPR